MKPFSFDPAARAEWVEATLRYASISPELGARFIRHIETLIWHVCENPTGCRVYAAPVRRHFGRRFPYSIMFVDRPDQIWIVAVMHFKQRPGYWKDRLSS